LGWHAGPSNGALSAVVGRLSSGAGIGTAAVIITLQPALLAPILVTVAVPVDLMLLLIATLALIAVYSRDQTRRDAAQKILDQLLITLRPSKSAKEPLK
jgi:hypothetical protein